MRKANSEQSNNTKETINYYPFGSEMRMSSPYQIIRKNGITQVDCPAVSQNWYYKREIFNKKIFTCKIEQYEEFANNLIVLLVGKL